ncbi:hypothetical protein [Komagataeibacter oboediens]|uniref:hypothetical protein n=1 Tax=Komagataeibacter oboediens TaxID=65958 RepID=UPI0011B4CABD|nr:hypothetical protein [Komagataeibacter oboediens]
MSRYNLSPNKEYADLIVTVGWDAPMQTYFGQVADPDADGEDDDLVLWVGTASHEIPTIDRLAELVSDYAVIATDVREKLHADYVASLDRGPTPLQRFGRTFFK